MAAIKRFNLGDKVNVKADGVSGVVINLGIGLGDNTPERLEVKVGEADIRNVYAESCELLDAVASDPQLPDDSQDDEENDDQNRLDDLNAN